MCGLHGLDRPLWPQHPIFLLRVAFDHLLGVALGIAMIVMVMEGARARTEELNDKMRRLTLLTAASTQTLSVQEVAERVLRHVVDSLSATHGLVRLIEGEGTTAKLVIQASVGFSAGYLDRYGELPISDPWVQDLLGREWVSLHLQDETDLKAHQRLVEAGLTEAVTLTLSGKDGPLGIVAVGSARNAPFQADEISYLVNIVNLLGLTLLNVRLFAQVSAVQQQWEYTFDSIGDPILVHDTEARILRSNQRLGQLLGRESASFTGRRVSQLLPRKGIEYERCPYCEGLAGQGDDPDPWLPGYFLASNSVFKDPSGRKLGTVHVLKDISDRKRAEEKYRTLVSSVQEGVFISSPQGHFLDFNDAMLRISGYESREELGRIDIGTQLYVNPSDRERLKRILDEHGTVADFEFDMRRKDGEIRTILESSIAVRDSAGNISAYQGFLLDITERKRAEREIRRRNRELMVLNSIAQTLTESMDLGDSLHATLRQMSELFSLDTLGLYLIEGCALTLRRMAAVGHRSKYGREFSSFAIKQDLLEHVNAKHAKFLSAQGLALPEAMEEVSRREEIKSSYVLILWSKDRVVGWLVMGSRTRREFSPADINLLIAVGSQLASAIERSSLHEETRQAYDNLRRTQEQLLHSEKMAAVGQLIAGVAHELNNPLTAILGYSQLLSSSGQMGPQGLEYSAKLYKQAQRTHRIVQNLLSFARQHKPERIPVYINQIVEDTLALRDYDLRMSDIRVHLDLAEDLPATAADPHQLQQVFLNLVNNAVDAILEVADNGDLWVRTAANDGRLLVQFTDSGPGVRDAARVFDPFYTTKPVGKGTGLGLSICYGIIVEHGGAIRVCNVPGRGASFTIDLPFQTVAQTGEMVVQGQEVSGRAGLILVVDQDDSVVEAVGAILRDRGHQVHTARNLSEAAQSMEKNDFDLVVGDLQLADAETGTSLREWLWQHKPRLSQRLIGMCTVAPRYDVLDQQTRSHCQLLQKPFKTAELLAAVDATLLGHIHATVIDR
ncbi:MAG: hypothetical protein NVS9B4_17400 [Candidatus Acidiferrum sp.]